MMKVLQMITVVVVVVVEIMLFILLLSLSSGLCCLDRATLVHSFEPEMTDHPVLTPFVFLPRDAVFDFLFVFVFVFVSVFVSIFDTGSIHSGSR